MVKLDNIAINLDHKYIYSTWYSWQHYEENYKKYCISIFNGSCKDWSFLSGSMKVWDYCFCFASPPTRNISASGTALSWSLKSLSNTIDIGNKIGRYLQIFVDIYRYLYIFILVYRWIIVSNCYRAQCHVVRDQSLVRNTMVCCGQRSPYHLC